MSYIVQSDKFVHKQSGASHICAGAIAQKYLSMQGKVKYYGKPFTPIYQKILEEFPHIVKVKSYVLVMAWKLILLALIKLVNLSFNYFRNACKRAR